MLRWALGRDSCKVQFGLPRQNEDVEGGAGVVAQAHEASRFQLAAAEP